MGVKITELLPKKDIDISLLSQKTVAIDASLFLYQFLSSIRQRDGSLLVDSKGNVTSHLAGLFSRTSKFLEKGLFPVYVFDGVSPKLKLEEQMRRRGIKETAEAKYKIALDKKDVEEMKKYASRTSKLTKEMVEESKELLKAMGVPFINSPSEGEAQAAFLVKKGDAFCVASQDTDSLLFGSPRLVRNLSVFGRRKLPNRYSYEHVSLELVSLDETLNSLGLVQDQLIALCMLVGTDFNVGGIKGIGPKNAVKLVKQYGEDFDLLFKEVKWDECFDYPWEDVYYLIKNMKTTEDYSIEPSTPDIEQIKKILVDNHDFSEERISKTLETLNNEVKKKQQKSLFDF